jgi:hypothetical protein
MSANYWSEGRPRLGTFPENAQEIACVMQSRTSDLSVANETGPIVACQPLWFSTIKRLSFTHNSSVVKSSYHRT